MNKIEKEILRKHLAKAGKKGGSTTAKKYGSLYMSNLVKKRWAKAKKKAVENSFDKNKLLV